MYCYEVLKLKAVVHWATLLITADTRGIPTEYAETRLAYWMGHP